MLYTRKVCCFGRQPVLLTAMDSTPDGKLLFVLPEGQTAADASPTMQAAFKAADVESMEPSWIITPDCLARKCRDPAEVFVCDPFEGTAFEHLRQIQARVVGPLCVSMAIQVQKPLPRRPEPVFSLAFRGLVITCSVLPNEERERIKTQVELMGGSVVAPLTASVTHVVAGEVGSKKYHVAAIRKMPVMQPSWVQTFWEQEQHKLAHASSPAYSHLRLPAFKGLVITVSQVPASERKELQALVESNGGSYSGQLHCKTTTHVALLEAAGEKYNHARLWKLHCVHIRWLYESAQAGYALDESLYALEPSGVCKKSTPSRHSEDVPLPSWDCSVIATTESTRVNETARTNESTVTCEAKSTHSLDGANESAATLCEAKSKDPVDDIDVDKLSSCCGQFLDGCCILLWGFAQEKLEKMRRIVNACGGVRLDEYKEEVTHVVAEGPHLTPEIMKIIKRDGGSPYVVSAQWFMESSALGRLQMIDKYLLVELHSHVDSGELPSNCLPNNMDIQRKSAVLEHGNQDPSDFSDIVEQYRASNNVSMNARDDRLTSGSEKSMGPVTGGNIEKNATLYSFDVCVKNGSLNEQPLEQCEPADALFTGMTFRIHDFSEGDELILKETITQNGGKIWKNGYIYKDRLKFIEIVHLVIDPTKDCSSYDGLVVTYYWLEACLHKESLLCVDEDALFRPFLKPLNGDPLRGCVISFSQYSTPERECLVHLAESMGATCQDSLVRSVSRKQHSKILPNTHLIAREPEGSKYEAALKWGLPVVTKEWLVASARRGKKMDEDRFLLNGVAQQPQTRKSQSKMTSFQKEAQFVNAPNQNEPCTDKFEVSLIDVDIVPLQPDEESHRTHYEQVENCYKVLPHRDSTGRTWEAHSARSSISNTSICKKRESCTLHEPGFVDEGTDNAVDERSKVAALEPTKAFCTPGERRKISTGGVSTPGSFLKSQRIRELLSESHNSMNSSVTSPDASSDDESFQQAIDGSYRPKLNIVELENFAAKENQNASKKSRPCSLGKQIVRNLELNVERFCAIEDIAGLLDSPSPSLQTAPLDSARSGSRPLAGAVVCVSKWLSHVQKELGDIVCELGGEFMPAYAEHCTHLVYQGKPGEPLPREVVQAREQGKKLVSSGWVYACKGSGSWLDEADFPSAHDERLSLMGHVSTVRVPKQRSPQSALSQLGSPKQMRSPHHGENGSPKKPPSTVVQPRRLTESQQMISDQLDELMNAAKAAGRRRPPPAPVMASPIHPVLTATDSTKPSVITSLPLPDSESQFVGVTWDDPTRRLEMARLAGKLAEIEPSSQPATEQSPEEGDDVFEEAEPVMDPPVKVFVLSGFSDEQKIHYASIISKLKGVLLTSKAYNPEMTHLVLVQALKSERYLGALAAGKYILHTAYLDESAKAGKFLDEEEFEWGGPLTESCLVNLSTASAKSHKSKGQPAFAPRRWRQRIAQSASCKGAFSEWHVVIYASASKEAAYVNVLTAGGATIIPPTAVCPGLSHGEVTHALFDAGMAKGVQLDLLVGAGVLCLKAEYLAAFLVDDPVPPPEKFYISEAVKLLNYSVSSDANADTSSVSKRSVASTSGHGSLALGAKRRKQ